MMDFSSDLYKWNKHESKLKAKIKESNSIQTVHQWLRKVEDVTDNAIHKVFKNDQEPAYTGLRTQLTTDALNVHTDTYSEAHELLSRWVGEKVRLDFDNDFFNYVDVSEMNKFQDNLKTLDDYNPSSRVQEIIQNENFLDIPSWDYDKYDQNYIVDDLMKQMSKKNFVNTKKLLKTPRSASNVPDIRTKIELRHQQVKLNREKRMKEAEEKRKEKLAKKEAELEARRLLQKEEQQKKLRANIEQQLLEQEIEKLRKERIEQRKKEDELSIKNKEIELARLEKEKKTEAYQQKIAELSLAEVTLEAKRREIEEKQNEQLVQSFLKAKSTRLNQLIFSSWYGIILDRRLKIGKAKALYDWKIQYKLFNSWKKEWINSKIKKEQETYENLVKIENIKNSKATNYYKMKLLSKCMIIWHNYTRNERLNKRLQEDKNKTKNRIEKFLEAASQGKLVQNDAVNQQVENKLEVETPQEKKSIRKRPNSASYSNRSKPPRRDTSSARVANEDDSNLDLMIDIPSSERDAEIARKVRKNMWPWVKTPFIANNYENRHKAHEKLLHEQQKMIKEQQRIIEELRYEQNRVAFKEQIALLEQIKAKQDELEKMQQTQYKQEKKLLREASLLHEAKKRESKTPKTPKKDENLSEQVIVTSDRTTESNSVRTNTTINLSKQPEFLKNMEDRAKIREQMRKAREEKKKLDEYEKLKQIQAQQEEKLKQEDEEKRRKLDILKEKRRIEREMREKREADQAKEVELMKKADNFYRIYLLRYYCMNGLKKLLDIREKQNEIALNKYEETLKLKAIRLWKHEIDIQIQESNNKADLFYQKYLFSIYFKCGLRKHKISLQLEESKALRHYKYHIKFKLFSKWKFYKNVEKEKYVQYDLWIDKYYAQNLLKKCLIEWKLFPNEMKKQREREKRLNEMRNRVQSLIPDFKPGVLVSTSTSSNVK